MFKRIDHIELIPTDFQRTLDFYTNVLEFQLKERFSVHAGPLEEIAYIALGDTVIELMRITQAAPMPAAQFIVGYHALALEVDDMDQAVAYLQEKNIPIVWGPMDLGKSKRAEIRDPDGLTIELRQW
ncbi:MAG TPA: VOC family protein [Armatimonadota bacterium]|nr:VOC family protein [Armatimonadota bacterium]